MPATKLIYGVGRVPKASEFALGEIIVNVDDSKVYSKNKQNTVFEVGGGGTTIIDGSTPIISSITGFITASVGSDSYTTRDTNILKFRGGTGINITTGTGNEIFITATGDTEVTNAVNADTASYVEIAQTASYVNTSNIDGTLFELSSDGDQGGIIFSENNINNASNVNAYAAGLSNISNVVFAQVSSSGLLFASLSYDDTPITHVSGGVVVYDSSSGRFYYTGSYGGGGSGDSYWFLDTGNNQLTSSRDILVRGDISSSRLFLPQGADTQVAGIIFGEQAGNSGYIYDDGVSMHLGYNDEDIITVSSSNDFKLLVAGGARLASGHLQVEGNITASNPDGASGMGNISASGLLFASASQPAAHADSIVAVVYDTSSGQFYYTGSYGAGGSGADNDWFIDTVNSQLTASLNLLLTSSNQNQYIYFNSGNVNDITNIKNAYISNTISDTTYGQEIKLENYYNEGVIELEIGEKPFVTAKKNANPVVVINDDSSDIDFNVKGDTDPDLLYVNAGEEKVGIGYNNPTEKLSVDGGIFAKETVYIGSAAGSPKIQFNKSVNANSATTAEVSILADNTSYKQSLNFYNVLGSVGSDRYSTFTIGSNEYFRADFNNGAKADKAFIINGNSNNIDFIVSGSNFPDLLVAAVDSDNVGVGYGSSSLSATYGDYKLAVSGNLYSDGYLTLASKDNTTGVAGALMYSSSNEFYLGFS